MICGESVSALKARLNALVEPPRAVIDLAQLKAMLTVYYSTPWAVLERSDNCDSLPDAKAIEYKLVDVPTTGQKLADALTWCQLRAIMLPLADSTETVQGQQVKGWPDYVLRTWTGQSPNEEYPKVTANGCRELFVICAKKLRGCFSGGEKS